MPSSGENDMRLIIATRVSARMRQVFESIVDAVSGSDWSYLIVFVIAMLDAFFPIVPSEATAIAAGVVAAGAGGLQVELVILAAALGAFVGDNISFAGGHFLGERARLAASSPSEKSQKRLKWAEKTLRRARPLSHRGRPLHSGGPHGRRPSPPGSSNAMGWRRFLLFDAIACAIWGSYTVLLGYFGGKSFEEEPWKGLLLAFVVALAVTGVVEAGALPASPPRARDA